MIKLKTLKDWWNNYNLRDLSVVLKDILRLYPAESGLIGNRGSKCSSVNPFNQVNGCGWPCGNPS